MTASPPRLPRALEDTPLAPPPGADAARFLDAIERIDRANAEDPHRLAVRGVEAPKELAHAALACEWVRRFVPEPSEALLLAARAHHLERWRVPRSSYPDGRAGYLRWRSDLHGFHAERAAVHLRAAGYEQATIERVAALIHKRRLRSDAEAQALEDALCLVFLETQLALDWERIDDDLMVDVLRKSWAKMSPAGRDAALGLPLEERPRRLVERALGG